MSESNGENFATVRSLDASRVEHLQAEYDKADNLVRRVQDFRRRAGIPAINELRYAGYHLVSALSANDEQGKESHLVSAINHCRRASYEAAEAGVMTALDRIMIFKEDYRLVTITDCIPGWIEILDQCDQCKHALARSRNKGDDRSEDHEIHMDAFDELVTICRRLDVAREELNKKIIVQTTEARRFFLMAALAVGAIVVSLIVGLVLS